MVLGVLLFGFAAQGVVAETRQIPQSQNQIKLSYAPLVREAAPAVVNIYATRRVMTRNIVSPFLNDPFFQQFFGGQLGIPQMQERMENSLGSGVLVSADGFIVTNAHVIRGSEDITAILGDGREFKARLILSEDKTDMAVLKIEGSEKFPHLQMTDSDALEVGDLVLAIGNPFGVGQTVTSGIISAVARTTVGVSDYNFFIQTDAAINPGNSGGALVDMQGRMVGLNTAIYSRQGGGSLGIGFAIPANMVQTIIAAAKRGDTQMRRPWFGAGVQSVTADIADSLSLPRPTGALLSEVFPDSPAQKAGLKRGDLIVKLDQHEIQDANVLKFRLATIAVGDTAEFSVLRQGREKTLTYKAELAPDKPARDVRTLKGRHPLDGATISNLNPAVMEEFSLDFYSRGVVITDVARGGHAARLGIAPRDIVVQVGETRVENSKQLEQIMARGSTGGWTMQVSRDGRLRTVTIR